jgi:branched-chain amino acid aminotransferase
MQSKTALSNSSKLPTLNASPEWINFDGQLLRSGAPLLTTANRSFRYGDGLFETMMVRDGSLCLGSYHFDRLFSGMQLLQLAVPTAFDRETLELQILALCQKNGNPHHSRVRMVVYRDEGASSSPIGPIPHYIIESWPLPGELALNDKGLVIDVFPDGRKACDVLANLKSNNYLLYTLATLHAQKHALDDCLVLNSRDRLADSTIANLFYVSKGQFFTPPLSEGCVAGVMRRHLLENMPRVGFPVQEKIVTPEDLLNADEVFLTNAIKGIRWVGSFRTIKYSHQLTASVYQQLIV